MDDKAEGFLSRLDNANGAGNDFGESVPNRFAVDATNNEENMYSGYWF